MTKFFAHLCQNGDTMYLMINARGYTKPIALAQLSNAGGARKLASEFNATPVNF